ncbi:GNAT family N-acetyltransferase [Steroidobacter cummioxidans]|uniref:GNAT family N-acetyltransferase n=1 Tax=Steroidobacter cummioxidans TaxID=1803913 RepID=UPI000E323D1A|nr:N-acetyltransferase [Steroidobacter cummioxidans]
MSTSSDTPSIRKATPADAATMAELGAATFTETFGYLYPPEDLQAFLAKSHTLESWTRALTDPTRGVFVVEHESGRKIGFIAVGACKLPVENLEAQAGEIQQLYVLAEFHNLRLGRRLMDLGLEWLNSQGRAPLYIGVWSQNHGAQRFYGRYGFSKVGEYGFPVGNTVDEEFILKR